MFVTTRRFFLAALPLLSLVLPSQAVALQPPRANAMVVLDADLLGDPGSSVSLFGYIHLVSRLSPDGQRVDLNANASADFAAFVSDTIDTGPLKARLEQLMNRARDLKIEIQAKQQQIQRLEDQQPPDGLALQQAVAEMRRLQEELRRVLGEIDSVLNQIDARSDRPSGTVYRVVGAVSVDAPVSQLTAHASPIFTLVDSAGRKRSFVAQVTLVFRSDGSLRSAQVDSVCDFQVVCGPDSDYCGCE